MTTPSPKLEPSSRINPSALSLFSGAGGMDIGVEDAGFSICAQVESDEHCANTLRTAKKRGNRQAMIVNSDIRKVDPAVLRDRLGLPRRGLDLLFGGPPCQSFSLAGKQRGLDDERGLLLFQMIRFAKEFDPTVVFLEQVKGLLSSRGPRRRRGEVFASFIAGLEEIGYKARWQIIVAADFGVPQLRERLFLVATRGRNSFRYPEPTHAPEHECQGLFPCTPHAAVGGAIAGLGEPSPKIKGTTFHNREDGHVDVTPDRDRERIAQVPEGSYLAAQTHLPKDLIRGLTRKDTTKYLRMHRARPANTLRCGEIFYHPTDNRYLTPREYMRLHGFSDSYILRGPIRSRTGSVPNLDQHRQVANSVPPPLASVLASSIYRYISG